ncbi:MAG: virulence RhuM family protein [Aquisalinus sp.]|nr:virulence RhuM family protein [Aquisalinus sp.]
MTKRKGKYDPPLHIDLDPDEALARFIQADPDDDSADGPVMVHEDESTGHQFLIYATESGVKVELTYEGDSLWMSQSQIADLFGRDRSVITKHINNIFSEGELEEGSNVQKMHIARSTKPVTIYSLDVIISVGYRVASKQATMFRKWATQKLVQFATKGFVVDAERLKNPENRDHFKELRELIRDIRASEANLYKEVRHICALCSDYHEMTERDKNIFFATIQNKLHYAVTGMTGAEIRVDRANARLENMGLMSWKGDHPTQSDVLTAKNFLGEEEVKDLNRFTGMLLDYFEQQTDLRKLVTTDDARSELDKFIRNNDRPLLRDLGTVSKANADKHAKAQYKIFNEKRRELRHEEADKHD